MVVAPSVPLRIRCSVLAVLYAATYAPMVAPLASRGDVILASQRCTQFRAELPHCSHCHTVRLPNFLVQYLWNPFAGKEEWAMPITQNRERSHTTWGGPLSSHCWQGNVLNQVHWMAREIGWCARLGSHSGACLSFLVESETRREEALNNNNNLARNRYGSPVPKQSSS